MSWLACALGLLLPVGAQAPSVRFEPAFPDVAGLEATAPPVAFGPWPSAAAERAELHFRADRDGRMVRFGPSGQGSLVLELPVGTEHAAQGLLGVAFHPRFPADPRLFVHYTEPGARRSVLAAVRFGDRERFEVSEPEVLLEIDQPWNDHNGGPLAFGADGALYVAVGDGGSRGDPRGHAQNPGSLLGKLLRIDTGEAAKLEGDAGFGEGARREVFAIGLRDPRALVLAPGGQQLVCLDSGPSAFEEVNAVGRGDNLGWPLREGFVDFQPRAEQGPGTTRDPLAVLAHREGAASAGGCVVQADSVPGLDRSFVFADRVTGRVFAVALTPERGSKPSRPVRIGQVDRACALGTSAAGKLIVADAEGKLWRAR